MKVRKNWLLLGTGLLVAVLMSAAACTTLSSHRACVMKLPVPVAGAQYVGSESCADCHDVLTMKHAGSIHDRILAKETAIGMQGCETCHGPASKHVESEDPAEIISFSTLDADEASSVCLRCHSDGSQMDWAGTAHPFNDVACTTCHEIHEPAAAKALKQAEPGLCYQCHQLEQAKMHYPSHHPVREGQMVCSDCHANHGSLVNNLATDERLNDLCLNCHSRYQGPFVFEHAPVSDDCTICHDPHGTVANNLKKQNEPYLCLQCHEPHFHAGRSGGATAVGTSANLSPEQMAAHPDAVLMSWGQAYATKCTQCHVQIHGSDLPSQSVPGQGRALTR
ncbi:MAG: DmsE family decaheme c-type cytochrome [Deltaproteobacteria bacterium]|nr:DmsE family decaheme c-type cytochrome [Candidatus Anaeroferrophillacea bacterium]